MTPYSVNFITDIAAIDAVEWDSLTGAQTPFTRHAFLHALETSQSVGLAETGWHPMHMICMDNTDQMVGAMPLYIKTHSKGEYVFDQNWAEAYMRAGGAYYPKLQVAIPFSPVIVPHILTASHAENSAQVQRYMMDMLPAFAGEKGLSSAHMTFLPESEMALLNGSCDMTDEWLVRHDIQFLWENRGYKDFEAFLMALSARKRKQVRKERKAIATSDITVKQVLGADIDAQAWSRFFEFYMDTGSRKWGTPYLNAPFFHTIGQTMADQIMMVQCWRNDEMIAGALNLFDADQLYGRYWGCIEDHKYLHFEACYYQAIDFAINRGLQRVQAGAQGGHKLPRGYAPTLTTSIHFIENAQFRQAVADYLDHERRAVKEELAALTALSPYKETP